MERSGGGSEVQTSAIRRVGVASFIGTTMEWYDFFLYLTASALIFNQLFFPSLDPLIGTIAAFGTAGVGFVARPLGGLVFGHFGDRMGRRSNLIITLSMMGVATALIGVLPTYESVGIWAPILLVTLRLIQGFAVGGEWGGAVLMTVEHSPGDRRGFYGSWVQMGVPAGLVLADVLILVLSIYLPQEQFLAWGWRVPFLASILLVGVGLFIRLRIEESPAFSQVQESNTEAQMPLIDVVRNQPKNVLVSLGARLGDNVLFYIFSVFVLTYVTQELGLPRELALYGVLIGAVIELFTIPAFGALSDRIGRRPVFIAGAAFSALFAFPYFWLLNTEQTYLVWLASVLALSIGHAAMYAPEASFLSELFDTRTRYSGASIGYQLAPIVGGGLAPTIAASLLAWTGGAPWPIALYMIAMALITIVALYFAPETFELDIHEARPEEDRRAAGEPAG